MKRNNTLLRTIVACSTVIVLVFATAGCKKEEESAVVKAFDMAAAQKSIDSCNTTFMEAFNKGDASGVANCYTADAKFMPPNTVLKEGMPAIQKEIEEYFKMGDIKIVLKSVGLWGDNNLLVEENTWSITDKDGKELDHGKSLVAYKKEDGRWKMFRDCYNADTPCMEPSAETEVAPPAPTK